MTTDKKVARRKLSLLELASELANVSKACKIMGYSRQQFYEIRRNFQTYGADGLLDYPVGVQVRQRLARYQPVLIRPPFTDGQLQPFAHQRRLEQRNAGNVPRFSGAQ